jgi:hypothetical protein
MKDLFKKPDYLKPEINQAIYYPHILILLFVAGFIMSRVFGYTSIPLEISAGMIVKLVVALTAGDVVAHSLLLLD